MAIEYANGGLKEWLEIHQQLATKEKLFCQFPPLLFKEDPSIVFLRKLRPTQRRTGTD